MGDGWLGGEFQRQDGVEGLPGMAAGELGLTLIPPEKAVKGEREPFRHSLLSKFERGPLQGSGCSTPPSLRPTTWDALPAKLRFCRTDGNSSHAGSASRRHRA